MIEDKGIPIKNVYYMLLYAFRALDRVDRCKIEGEDFKDVYDLFATILHEEVSRQLKRGLHKEYMETVDDLRTVRGKLVMPGIMRNKMANRPFLTCEYDELSENNPPNQALKATLALLNRQKGVNVERKESIKRLLRRLSHVDDVDPWGIRWNAFHTNRSNQVYASLLNFCRFVMEGKLLTTEEGRYESLMFSDKQMERLFEGFVREYYCRHTRDSVVRAEHIPWDAETRGSKYLPIMKTDIVITCGGMKLIIDTKYYGETMKEHYGSVGYNQSHLYQIFSYVKNMERKDDCNVSGMLLYAKTQEEKTPDEDLVLAGSPISLKTLDLGVSFEEIERQLRSLVEPYFGTDIIKSR